MITSRFCITLLFFCSSVIAFSQQKENVPALKVGDPAPPLRPYKWIKGTPFTSYEKGKVYVLEFGATWCKPCIAMIPHLSSMADTNRDSLIVVSVFVLEPNTEPLATKNPAYVQGVRNFVSKRDDQIHYTVAVDDPSMSIYKTWLVAAHLQGVPHTIIVDKQGRISAITTGELNVANAARAALSAKYNLSNAKAVQDSVAKLRIPYVSDKLLLVDGNGGPPDKFLFRSVLTEYSKTMPGAPPLFVANHLNEPAGGRYVAWMDRFQAVGVSADELYYFAYGDTVWNQLKARDVKGEFPPVTSASPRYGAFWYEPLLEVKDQSLFQWTYASSNNRFNYSLKVPYRKGTAEYLQKIMRGDLRNYFGYDVRVEERMMPCWNVIALPEVAEKLKTATPGFKYREEQHQDGTITFHNADMRDMMVMLSQSFGFGLFNYKYLSKEDLAPFFDRTDFSGEFDFRYDVEYTRNFENCRKYLNALGLNLEKGTQKMKVIIISDPQ